MSSTSTVLGITNMCFICVSIFIFITIFVIIYKCRRDLRNVSFLLTCNTCLSGLLTCLTMCVMNSSNLSNGFLIVNLRFGCVWGLFYDIFECSIYHSYYLQSFYRLCRVVFHTKRSLQSYSLYIILIIIEWLLIFILLLPPYFLNWYARLPTQNTCLVPYTYVGPEVYHIVVLYTIPLGCIISTYISITVFMRRSSRTVAVRIGAQQSKRNERDLAVIKRIIILVSILVVLRFPTIIFMIYGIINGDLYPLTYSIVGLITTICLIIMALIIIYITPELRKNMRQFFQHQMNRVGVQRIQSMQMNIRNTSMNIQNIIPNRNS